MDIKNGILTLGDVLISPRSWISDFEKYPDEIKKIDLGELVGFDWVKPVTLDGVAFRVSLNFWQEKPAFVNLWPMTDEPQFPPSREVQARRRAICDTWLAVHLGTPQERTEVRTLYKYSWGWIQVFSVFEGKTPYDGGEIEIHYF